MLNPVALQKSFPSPSNMVLIIKNTSSVLISKTSSTSIFIPPGHLSSTFFKLLLSQEWGKSTLQAQHYSQFGMRPVSPNAHLPHTSCDVRCGIRRDTTGLTYKRVPSGECQVTDSHGAGNQ